MGVYDAISDVDEMLAEGHIPLPPASPTCDTRVDTAMCNHTRLDARPLSMVTTYIRVMHKTVERACMLLSTAGPLSCCHDHRQGGKFPLPSSAAATMSRHSTQHTARRPLPQPRHAGTGRVHGTIYMPVHYICTSGAGQRRVLSRLDACRKSRSASSRRCNVYMRRTQGILHWGHAQARMQGGTRTTHLHIQATASHSSSIQRRMSSRPAPLSSLLVR